MSWISQNYVRASIALIIGLAIYAISLWAAASSTFGVISSFQLSDIARGSGTIDETTDLALEKLDTIAESVSKTRRIAIPLLGLCGVGRVISPVRDNCDATVGLFDRFERDSSGAVALLGAVRSMNRLVALIRDGAIDFEAVEWTSSIEQLKLDLAEFNRFMVQAITFRQPEGAFTLPQLTAGYAKAASVERELRDLAEFIRAGIVILESAPVLAGTASDVFTDLAAAGGASASLSELRSALAPIVVLSEQFCDDVQMFVELMPPYFEGSSAQMTVESIGADANLIADLIAGIAIPLEILEESLSVERSTDGPLLTNGGILSILDVLIGHEQELADAGRGLLRATDALSGESQLQGLLGDDIARKLDGFLNRYAGLIKSLNDAPVVLKTLLGGAGEKTYLMLGQSSDELRPAGGLTSSLWLMTFDDGVLESMEYIDVLNFGEQKVLDQFPDVPDDLRTYMDVAAWYMRDVGWSPDFRAVAELAVLMNSATGRPPVDGVISMTQWGFVYLVSGLGTIDTPAGELAGNEVMAAIEWGTDSEGTVYLLSLFESMMDSLTFVRLTNNFTAFAESLLRAFAEKQIMIYSVDDDLENRITKLGWSGNVELATGDVIGLFDSNVGWNKVGRNIVRSVEYQVDLTPAGGGVSRLSVTYANNSDGDESACDEQSQRKAGGHTYSALKHGCYWNLMRVYTPVGARAISLPELPASDLSIAVRSGKLLAGTETADIGWDESGQYFRGLLAVPPQTVTTVVYVYEIPDGTADVDGDVLEYVLNIPIQAGVPTMNIRLRIVFPDGYGIVGASQKSDSTEPGIFQIDHVLDSDFELRVIATKAG